MPMRKAIIILMIIIGLATSHRAVGQGTDELAAGETGAKIERYLNKAAANGYAGSVLVAQKGKIILAKGFGLADRENGVQETAGTVFSIGSITKQFTGAAILKLEMMGKLSVHDPIAKYFPGVPADKKEITLHHLLTHTAGFPDALGDDYDLTGRDEFVKLALGSKLKFVPGERYRYSNVGFSLLGAIVELVSGKGYEDFLYENVFKPAGMERTGYLRPRFDKKDLAVGYQGRSRWGSALDRAWLADGPGWHLRANGGILSTVGDMYRWYLALKGDAVLSEAAKKEYFAPHVREYPDRDSYYGYGWVSQKSERGATLIWHNGGNGIYNAFMGFEPASDLAIIVSSNCAGKISDDYARRIEQIVFGTVREMDENALKEWAGTYRIPSGAEVSVHFDENDTLIAAYGAGELLRWLAASGKEKVEETSIYDRRVRDVITEAVAGDYAALAAAWGEPLADVQKRAPGFWGGLERQNGRLAGFDVLGTVSRPDFFLTYARLDLEKGPVFLTFVWEGGRLSDLRSSESLEREFEARSAAEFSSALIGTTILFEKDGRGAVSLVLRKDGGELRALKSSRAAVLDSVPASAIYSQSA